MRIDLQLLNAMFTGSFIFKSLKNQSTLNLQVSVIYPHYNKVHFQGETVWQNPIHGIPTCSGLQVYPLALSVECWICMPDDHGSNSSRGNMCFCCIWCPGWDLDNPIVFCTLLHKHVHSGRYETILSLEGDSVVQSDMQHLVGSSFGSWICIPEDMV